MADEGGPAGVCASARDARRAPHNDTFTMGRSVQVFTAFLDAQKPSGGSLFLGFRSHKTANEKGGTASKRCFVGQFFGLGATR